MKVKMLLQQELLLQDPERIFSLRVLQSSKI